jgi:hypothetical protein
MKKQTNKRAATKSKPLPPHLALPKVPADHPIYKSGYVVGGTYPARKPLASSEKAQLDKIANKLAVERNADPADENVQRDAAFQAAADRARAETPAPTGLAAQLSATIDQMMAEADDEATQQVLNKFQRNLAAKKPLTASQLAKRYGLEPTMVDNLKASQAQLKAMGRDLTLEEIYALEIGDLPEQ